MNWYPCLFLLGRDDPFGCRRGSSSAPPSPAVAMVGLALLVWRTGVHRYTLDGILTWR